MKTVKVMAIIGIIFSVIVFLCVLGFNNDIDYEAGLGWGMFGSLYFLAFSIVALVKSNKKEIK
jgi:hypothetical protein